MKPFIVKDNGRIKIKYSTDKGYLLYIDDEPKKKGLTYDEALLIERDLMEAWARTDGRKPVSKIQELLRLKNQQLGSLKDYYLEETITAEETYEVTANNEAEAVNKLLKNKGKKISESYYPETITINIREVKP